MFVNIQPEIQKHLYSHQLNYLPCLENIVFTEWVSLASLMVLVKKGITDFLKGKVTFKPVISFFLLYQ